MNTDTLVDQLAAGKRLREELKETEEKKRQRLAEEQQEQECKTFRENLIKYLERNAAKHDFEISEFTISDVRCCDLKTPVSLYGHKLSAIEMEDSVQIVMDFMNIGTKNKINYIKDVYYHGSHCKSKSTDGSIFSFSIEEAPKEE